MNLFSPSQILWFIDQFILGDFKWTVLGAGLVLLALLVARVMGRGVKSRILRALLAIVLVCVFVWYGHEWIDPMLHDVASWWVTPLGEPMELITR